MAWLGGATERGGEGMAVKHNKRIEEPAVAPLRVAPARPQAHWRLALGALMTVGILALAFFNRAWLLEAIGLTCHIGDPPQMTVE